jgi:CHAT domain-containing protein
VPLVVASQWSVDSDSTADLMIKFHRYRKQQNMPTVAALRQAQVDMLTNGKELFRQPYYWAAFVPVGGYANY